eukprot:COSAG02_NODE_2777_length_8052_cov_2.106626_3_plen_529_part_00
MHQRHHQRAGGARTERQRQSGGGLYFGLVTSDHLATDRAHRHNPWTNSLAAGLHPVPFPQQPLPPTNFRPAPTLDQLEADVLARKSWRASNGGGPIGYTPRDFFADEDVASSQPSMEPEPEENRLWLTGALRGPAPQPQPPTAARAAGRVAPANGRRQDPQPLNSGGGRRDRPRSPLYSSNASGPSGGASDSSSVSSWSSRGEARDLNRRVNKAIKIIRSVLQSWEGSLRETFQRVDTNRSGTIDAAEFATFLRAKLHMNFDAATLGEIMRHFADENTGEITYQSFCELVTCDQSERLESSRQMQKEAAEDAERDAEMLLRNRVRRSGTRLREIFDDVDRTGQGALSYDDLRFALHIFGVVMPEAQFDQLVRKIDTNNDQVITFQEFVNYFKHYNVDRQLSYVRHAHGFSLDAALRLIRETILNRCGASQRSIAKCFRVFDEDGSGEVDEQEFMTVLTKQLGLKFDQELATQIMATLDTDGNGTIGMEEFYKYVMGLSSEAIRRAKRSYQRRASDAQRSAMQQHMAEH